MSKAQLNQQELFANAAFYEYSSAADPIGSGLIPAIPYRVFLHHLHEEGPSKLIPLNIQDLLNCPYPATSPALLANFVRILHGDTISTHANATSHLFYVIRGNGHTNIGKVRIPWNTGDFFVLPAGSIAEHIADTDTAFYYVNDEPLLNYLGVKAAEPKFAPTLFTAEMVAEALQRAVQAPKALERNRISVLLASKQCPQTHTISHVLWAMYGALLPNQVQPPHRHQSVAIDFAVDCQPGCYTLIGKEIDEKGQIINPTRADWLPGSVFITPPGYWHSHHNESGVQAHVIPLQDAGLHTYLRTLDIRFSTP